MAPLIPNCLVFALLLTPLCVVGQFPDVEDAATSTPPSAGEDDTGGLFLDCCNEGTVKTNRTLVELGYLTAVKGAMHNRQGRAISGALSYAIEQINNCSCLLPDVELKLLYNDTEGKENKSTEALVDLICNDIAAFIGPEGPNCHTEAMVAGSKNRAMISYRCTDAQISSKEKYPTFTRMEPPDTQVSTEPLAKKNHSTHVNVTFSQSRSQTPCCPC